MMVCDWLIFQTLVAASLMIHIRLLCHFRRQEKTGKMPFRNVTAFVGICIKSSVSKCDIEVPKMVSKYEGYDQKVPFCKK